MKTKSTILRLIVSSCALATTAVFGQTTYTWIGAADGTNIATAGNWTTNGVNPATTLPNGTTQDTAQWNGVTTTDLALTYISGLPGTGFGTLGVNWNLTANQNKTVTIVCPPGNNSGTIGFNNIDVENGTLILGDNTANQLNFIGRPAGGTHEMVNNSANPATINPSVRWQAGGGSSYVLDFTGNWVINNYLVNDNGAGPTTIALESGSLAWSSGTSLPHGNSAIGPVFIFGGTITLKSPGLVPPTPGNNTIQSDGTLVFDAPAQSDNISRVISGAGLLQVNSGTLTLSGASTYSGNTLLNGGELIVGVAENVGISGPIGEGGTISFAGGTLGFTLNNIFDYSSRFDTSANQAYSFDTAGQNVSFATGLSSTGGTVTKVGPGTLTLTAASTYTGNTTVSAGRLLFGSSKTGAGNISIADGAILTVTATGTQVTPGTLTVGTVSGATLGFNNVNSTATAVIAAGTLSAVGTTTININSGTFTVGQSYPLLAWTIGAAPTASLGILNGYTGHLSVSGNTLLLTIDGTAYVWTGTGSGSWDLSAANNWTHNGGAAIFASGAPTLFDDTASGSTAVIINALVQPSSLTINNNTLTYSIASSSGNDISGSSGLTKSGSGTLTLSGGVNAYTGVTTVGGGVLSVGTLANGGSASDIGASANSAANLVFDGGALQYTGGGASIDRLFTLTQSGGTIDSSGSGALTLNNTGSIAYSGNGSRVFTLTGVQTAANNTLAASISDNGGPTALAMSGIGTWVLTGNNTESGVTTISSGTLQIGAGGANGSIGSGNIINNGSLDFNRTGTLTVSGAVSGTGSVTNDGSGTVILVGNNTYSSGTTINAGTLQFGNGGATGAFDANGNITDNGTLIVNTTGTFTHNGTISGTGQFIKRGSGLVKLLGTETYTGGTTIDAGGALQISQGNQGTFAAIGNITNNGSLIIGRQDNGVFGITNNIIGTGSVTREINNTQGGGDITLMGINTYTGGTFINGGEIILGDGVTPGAGSIVGNVTFAVSPVGDGSRFFEFNRPDDFTFPGIIGGIPAGSSGANQGVVIQNGPNTVTLTGANTYAGGTTINAGRLIVGNGGSIGTGLLSDNGVLIYSLSNNVTFIGGINGTGLVAQAGSGTLTLTGNLAMTSTVVVTNDDSSITTNIYFGTITASNGTLVVNSPGGIVNNNLRVDGGALIAGGVGTVSTLNVSNNLTITSGSVIVSLNKSLSLSNTMFIVAGSLARTGGTLNVTNYGTPLVVGDKFYIFNKAVTGGAGMTIIPPSGVTFANNLAVDGSITVTSAPASTSPKITSTFSAGVLNLTWPASTGLSLQVQTNSLSKGLSTNWVTIPGTAAVNTYSVPVSVTNGSVFYRLAP